MFGSRNKDKAKNKNKASKDKPVRPSRQYTPSIISADMNILGNLVSDGRVDIDGRIEGNVKASQITIRQEGVVNGDVQADEVQIYGHVNGLVRAKDVHLYSTAHVEGSIMHEVLSMEEGAFVDGKFKRSDRMNLDEPMVSPLASDTENKEVTEEDVRMLENIRLISNKASE